MNDNDIERELTPCEREQEARDMRGDWLRDEMRDRQWEEAQERKRERPTPITDAATKHARELPTRSMEIVSLRNDLQIMERQLAEAREQRDRLADALRNIKAGLENEQAHGLWDAEDIIEAIINPALAAVKGGSHE